MIDQKFVQMMQCPINKTPLHLADKALVQRVNFAINRSELRDRVDQKVSAEIEGGLLSGRWLYPIRGGIPTLIADEAIEISDFVDASKPSES